MKKRLSVLTSLLLVLCILFSLAACQKNNRVESDPNTEPTDQVIGYFEENYESYTLYDDILNAYASAQAADYYGGDLQQCGDISQPLVEEMQAETEQDSEYELLIVYVYVDLCNDNEPELFIGRRHKHHPGKFRIYDAWGCRDGRPHRLFDKKDFRPGHYDFFDDGRFCFTEEDTPEHNHCIYYRLSEHDTNPVLIEQLRWEQHGDKKTYYRFDADGQGEEIKQSEYENKKNNYKPKECVSGSLTEWYEKQPASHTTEPTQETTTTAPETTVLAENETLLEETDLYTIIRIDNSVEMANFYFDLLQMKGNSPTAQLINREMLELYAQYSVNLPDYASRVQEAETDETHQNFYHYDTVVRYSQNNLLSVTVTYAYYLNGYSDDQTTGYTYNLSTSEKTTLTQLFSHMDKNVLTDCCKQALLHYLDKNNLMFSATYLQDVLASMSSDTINYYVDTDGDIVFIYNKYDLAGGVIGIDMTDADFSVDDTLTVPTAEQINQTYWWHLYKKDETAFMNIRSLSLDTDTNNSVFASGWYASEGYETAYVTFSIDADGTYTAHIDTYQYPTNQDDPTMGRENMTCSYKINRFGKLLVLTQLSSEGVYYGDAYGTCYVYYLKDTSE